jgi:hypothetical protein
MGQAGKVVDGDIDDTRQDGGQVVTDRNLRPAAGLYYRQNRRHLRAGLLAAYVDPVLPAQCPPDAWSSPPDCYSIPTPRAPGSA